MKKIFSVLVTILLSVSLQRPWSIAGDDFCVKLENLMASAREHFTLVKGEAVERMITGTKKKFFNSKIKFIPGGECYINDDEAYPECACILATDHAITDKLTREYENYKNKIKQCLKTGYVITEKDSTNDFYLKGTEFRKLSVMEQDGEQKLKMHLYMYSSMIEKSRVVELKIEGIGAK